jgi:hypothetical protein
MKLCLLKLLAQILYKNEPNNSILNSDKNRKLQREHGQVLKNVVWALANWMIEYLMNREACSGSHHPAPGLKTLLTLIFYCGIPHEVDNC